MDEAWQEYSKPLSAEEKAKREEGIRYETGVITSTGMADYFILDHAIVKRAKELGGVLSPTGRGSAVSFFTNMLLGFSSVDRYEIPVEMFPDRFISADRILTGNLPDIDLNCGNEEVFMQAQTDILGEWRSAPMVAFGTLKRLSAWKMYCRANDIPFEVANQLSDKLKAYELAVKHADEDDEIDLMDYVPQEYHELLRESERYLGMIDSISPHPCAHLLCCKDIRREIGIFRMNAKGGKKKTVYAAFIDGNTAEKFGYLKNDLLHVDVVAVNQDVFDRIGIQQPPVRELLDWTADDKETWRMYKDGYTMGLNQVERPKTQEKVMHYRPRNITELASFVAAVRPSFKSMLPVFLARRHFDYSIPVFDRLIQTRDMRSSFILFQEQVMKALQYGSFSGPESYAAIKAIGKKHPEQVLPLKARFLEGFAAHLLADDGNCAKDQAT